MELEAVPAATPMGHGLVTSRGLNGILDYGQGGTSPRNLGQGEARAMGQGHHISSKQTLISIARNGTLNEQ